MRTPVQALIGTQAQAQLLGCAGGGKRSLLGCKMLNYHIICAGFYEGPGSSRASQDSLEDGQAGRGPPAAFDIEQPQDTEGKPHPLEHVMLHRSPAQTMPCQQPPDQSSSRILKARCHR